MTPFVLSNTHDNAITQIHATTPVETAGAHGSSGAGAHPVRHVLVRASQGVRMSGPLDQIDTAVYQATINVRRQYVEACARLGLTPRPHTAVTLGMRSVR